MPAFVKITVPQGTSLQMYNNFDFWVATLMNSCVLFYYINWLILTSFVSKLFLKHFGSTCAQWQDWVATEINSKVE